MKSLHLGEGTVKHSVPFSTLRCLRKHTGRNIWQPRHHGQVYSDVPLKQNATMCAGMGIKHLVDATIGSCQINPHHPKSGFFWVVSFTAFYGGSRHWMGVHACFTLVSRCFTLVFLGIPPAMFWSTKHKLVAKPCFLGIRSSICRLYQPKAGCSNKLLQLGLWGYKSIESIKLYLGHGISSIQEQHIMWWICRLIDPEDHSSPNCILQL